jgi:hypothetical protein
MEDRNIMYKYSEIDRLWHWYYLIPKFDSKRMKFICEIED